MAPTHEPPGFDEIQHEERSRIFGSMASARLLVLPFAAVLLGGVLVNDPSTWRRIVIVAVGAVTSGYFLIEHVRYRRRGLASSSIPTNLSFAVVVQMTLTFATGGLTSPFMYVCVPLSLVTGIALSRRQSIALVVFQQLAIWAMTAIELRGRLSELVLASFGGGARSGLSDTHLLTTATFLSIIVVFGRTVGCRVQVMINSMLRRALVARQESLRAHAELASGLAALSGEIAHELKNPLASIKGLSGLLADNLRDGKGAERLAVLRREVERMQGILEEFLNFSRPLVPLNIQNVELGELCEEVEALHEGMARERAHRFELDGEEAVTVRCDPRKVKQILINLVQNAMEASPPGTAIRTEVRSRSGTATVTVLDRGRGLDATLGERVFEAGVTTKAGGSGLGLTIARALARQHGGELSLRQRPDGGCAAELMLPCAPITGQETQPAPAQQGVAS